MTELKQKASMRRFYYKNKLDRQGHITKSAIKQRRNPERPRKDSAVERG